MISGGYLENKIEAGEFIGPTFKCILADAFLRLKVGDRFFYDLNRPENKFSEEQLQEIRKATMSRIMCDNSESVKIRYGFT